jgi:serine/threonine-protein kinase
MKPFLKLFRLFLFLLLVVGASGVSGYLAMKIALGGGEVPVPSVAGKHVVDALEIMGQSGLGVEIGSREYDTVVEKHSVIRQVPAPGRRVKRGRRIVVILSKGPRDARVPDLRGESWSRSVNILKTMGFQVGRVAWVESGSHYENAIISQVPQPGRIVERGKGVNLLVSKGAPKDSFLMPDFVGKDLGAVKQSIRNATLRVGRVVQEEYPGVKVGVVLRHEPRAGYRIKGGDSVSLVVARGSKTGASPTGAYAFFRYQVSEALGEKMVRIVLVNEQETREIFRGRKKGGQEVGLLVKLRGKTTARIYLDGKLTEERVLQ